PPVTAFEPVVPLDRPLPSVATDYPQTEALDTVDLPPTDTIESGIPASAPNAVPAAVSNETTGLDRLDQLFTSSDTSADTIPLVSAREPEPSRSARAARAETPARESSPEEQVKFRQRLLLTIGGILVAIVAIGAWVMGGIVATPTAAPVPMETEIPLPPTATQPPGEYPFGQLFGGECLDPFVDAWAENYTVVDCATPHAAQLVYAGDLAIDGTYPSYPGDSRIGKAALAGCSRKGVLDLSAAKKITDLQISAAYPASSVAWDSGDTRYFCFASRASATPLAASIAGTLMTQPGEPTPEATPSD
ncbi:MAG: septum formation family protein, partial [Microbacteriaceae bacterium]|nr:septum formation family protein [Microbacteriaceae bacterium]